MATGQYNTRFHPEKIHESVWIAPGAIVVGDVTLHDDVSVWFNAVLRGDTESLVFGAGTNIQDGVVCHADPDYPLIVGEGVTVGHNAILHGARIGDNTLIGMGAIVLNGASIGANCIVGAGALITQNKTYPDNSLIFGSPSRLLRELSAEEISGIRNSAAQYVAKARAFKQAQA